MSDPLTPSYLSDPQPHLQADMSKPPVVIVPGAWQKPAAWDTFIAYLCAAGYSVELVALPSVGGTSTPLPGLAEDIEAIQAALASLTQKGSEPLLLCHSSGGLPGSNAVCGFDVAGIIYLSGFMIPQGRSILDVLGGQPLSWMKLEVRHPLPSRPRPLRPDADEMLGGPGDRSSRTAARGGL